MSEFSEDKIRIVIEGDSENLKKTLNNVNKQLDGFNDKVKRSAGTQSGGIGLLNQGLKRMVGLAAAAFAVERIANFSKEAFILASRMEGIERNFEQIAATGASSLQQLRSATMGAVSDFDLMQKAVQARNFKLPLENLAQFFEFATIRSQQTGESVDYLVNSIVLGIGRKSPLILDNLGITLVRLKEAMGKVGRESATVADISQAVAKISKEETDLLKALGKTAKTTGQEIDTLSSSWKNFRVVFGESFKETGASGVGYFADALQDATNQMDLMNQEGAYFLESLNGAISVGILSLLGFEKAGDDASAALARLEERAKMAETEFRIMLGSMFRQDLTKGGAEAYKRIADQLQILQASGKITAEEFQGLGNALLAIISAKDGLDKVLSDMSAFEKLNEIVDSVNDKLKESKAIFSVDYNKESFVKRDIGIYTKAMVELDLAGKKNSKTYREFRQELSRLHEEMANLNLPDLSPTDLFSDEDYDEAIEDALKRMNNRRTKPTEFEETINTYRLEDEEAPEAKFLTKEQKDTLSELTTMLSQLSTAMSQISSIFGSSDSDIARFVSGFTKVVAVVSAAAGAIAAFKSFFDGGSSAVKAVAIGTGVAAAIGGLASVSAGGSKGAGFNLRGGGNQRLYTEIDGRNLRIVLDREGRFSDRRG